MFRNFLLGLFALLLMLICTNCKKENAITEPIPAKIGIDNGYKIRHTNVQQYFDTLRTTATPASTSIYYQQDATYYSASSGFIDNSDGTISDKITGLMWQKSLVGKMTLEEAQNQLNTLNKGKYNDWRIPTIKELFSLIDYSGQVFGDKSVKLFINTQFFNQPLGNTALGEREIDAQTWSSTDSKSLTMGNDASRYGVNFVDGRVKAYPITDPMTRNPNKMYFRFVRGNVYYGLNKFIDNGDGTITDKATGLMWQKKDNQLAINWYDALQYAQNLYVGNYADWRLPNVKELQSLLEYEITVENNAKPSINSLFEVSIRNAPDGSLNYPFYWSSTTLLDGLAAGDLAAYVCFGKSTAQFNGQIVNAHGVGSVRSDPKTADGQIYPQYFGPQGDIQYVKNYVRCVRYAQ